MDQIVDFYRNMISGNENSFVLLKLAKKNANTTAFYYPAHHFMALGHYSTNTVSIILDDFITV